MQSTRLLPLILSRWSTWIRRKHRKHYILYECDYVHALTAFSLFLSHRNKFIFTIALTPSPSFSPIRLHLDVHLRDFAYIFGISRITGLWNVDRNNLANVNPSNRGQAWNKNEYRQNYMLHYIQLDISRRTFLPYFELREKLRVLHFFVTPRMNNMFLIRIVGYRFNNFPLC